MTTRNPYEDDIVISWAELHRDTRYLSSVLHELGAWKGIIAITRGGMVPAALLPESLIFGSSILFALQATERVRSPAPNKPKEA